MDVVSSEGSNISNGLVERSNTELLPTMQKPLVKNQMYINPTAKLVV